MSESDKHRALLEEAHGHLEAAADHLDAGRESGARRRIGMARGCIERALGGVYTEPTGATGAQTSDGQEPRSAQDWAQRLFSPGRAR